MNHDIYRYGVEVAFGRPDVVIMSFSTNDMAKTSRGEISFESAVQSLQTLINQAVASGANCIVLLEASHQFFGVTPPKEDFHRAMDQWFDHWHSVDSDSEFLGIPYQFLIADISDEVHADPDKYLSDFIHLSPAGAELAAQAILDQVNLCPEGRWIFGEKN